MFQTEAWILEKGNRKEPGELKLQQVEFGPLEEGEVLAEPIYGCWEANMTHAIARDPVDIVRQRSEERIILGNSGVVKVLEVGPGVKNVKAGEMAATVPIGSYDKYGFLTKVWAYDQPRSMGLLAKLIKLHEYQLITLPVPTKYTYQQWAAFVLKYSTAWSNWKVALGCWHQQMSSDGLPNPSAWGWGGGVALAELALAKFWGFKVAMVSSVEERLQLMKKIGITPIDRREFMDLSYNEEQYKTDREYKKKYLRAERAFLDRVKEHTGDAGVDIFIDNIGEPVYPATLRALGRQGVISTVGWKLGMNTGYNRAMECISRHIHVFTHGSKYSEGSAAMHFGEETGWIPPLQENEKVYQWDEIPQLAKDYEENKIATYFPIFQINPMN